MFEEKIDGKKRNFSCNLSAKRSGEAGGNYLAINEIREKIPAILKRNTETEMLEVASSNVTIKCSTNG